MTMMTKMTMITMINQIKNQKLINQLLRSIKRSFVIFIFIFNNVFVFYSFLYRMPSSTSPKSTNSSLLQRLAGPSSSKPGLNIDQNKVNKIIHDNSKGGKFYNNEVKRDLHTTNKINELHSKLRKYRRDIYNESNIVNSFDKAMNSIENERDLNKYIMHCDIDMFFAAVECLDNPSLIGRPFGVGKGILTTASYEARKFGIRSAMPGNIFI